MIFNFNIFKPKETIFFATFNSETMLHDRCQYFNYKYNKKDFFDWVENKRNEIEKQTKRPTIVINMKII